MVFSWARSVFTKKLVTSPIRIWDGEETSHTSDMAFAAGLELEMMEASYTAASLLEQQFKFTIWMVYVAARHPNTNTSPSLSAQWEFVNLSVSYFSWLHFPSFCNQQNTMQLHIPRTV